MKSILVVDDQRDIADSLAMVLEQYGYEVHVAYSAEQALARVVERTPDTVVMDLGMPDVDGYEAARRLRSMRGSQLHLIAHTGRGDDETKQRVTAAGFDAHVLKPASVPELIAVIN